MLPKHKQGDGEDAGRREQNYGNIMKSCNNPDLVLVKTIIKSLRFGDEATYN